MSPVFSGAPSYLEAMSDAPAPRHSGSAIPASGWGLRALGIALPLVATVLLLNQQLKAIPSEAWTWSIDPLYVLAALVLVPVNWGLEAFKWAELMPWGKLASRFRQVLYGTAWSLIGPLRLGAVVGRVAAVHPRQRGQAVRAFATASVSQWWCTITAAGLALLATDWWPLSAAVLGLSAVVLGLYFGWSPTFWKWIRNTRWTRQWRVARRIATIRRRRALSLSIVRYLVMLAQFVLLLTAFGHLAHWDIADQILAQLTGGAGMWGLTSLAPFPLLGDLGIREAAAMLTLPAPTPRDATAILGATLTLWGMNLLLPAVVGVLWQWSAYRSRGGAAKL